MRQWLLGVVSTGKSEIGELNDYLIILVAIQEEVLQLDITMYDRVFMTMRNGQCHLVEYLFYSLFSELILYFREYAPDVGGH